MDRSPVTPSGTARRTVVAAAGATGLAAMLAACGSSGSSDSGSAPGGSGTGTSAAGSAAAGSSGTSSQGGGSAAGSALAKTSDIPKGGGQVFADQKVVVTQPAAGVFKGFSAVCPHAGCTVSEVADGTINCPCHGSRFSIADGSVTAGPSPSPLPPQKIQVQGGSVSLA